MSMLIATDKYIAVAKELQIDCFDNTSHKIIDIPIVTKNNERDYISDITISSDNSYLAVVTATSKQLIIFDLPSMEKQETFTIPRSASKIRFSVDNTQILVADKSGDVLLYTIKKESSGTKLLGHLSLLLDVLQTYDSKLIISCDRDEKIRVSCYPNTYNIQTYCLGHKEFVNNIELLPHDNKYLTSSSGDGTIKIWDYTDGKLYHTIDSSNDLNDDQLKQNFINLMDEGGIEVSALPIVHYSSTKICDNTSILAITIHSNNEVILYSLKTEERKFSHNLEAKLKLSNFPSGLKLSNEKLIVYYDSNCSIDIYKLKEQNGKISVDLDQEVNMFEDKLGDKNSKENQLEAIKVLYKRKFDNVQEYQERKKQRLQKSGL